MTTIPSDFIDEWTKKNPEDCIKLARAVLYCYFSESSDETDDRILSLQKTPDSEDLHNELIDAIRDTSIVENLESVLGISKYYHIW
jgi:hypothetical protein